MTTANRTLTALRRLAAISVLVGLAIGQLTACNTVEGVGEDMSAAGQTMADWASDKNPESKD